MTADSAERIAHRNSRPAKRMGAGALFRDRLGRVLLVEPTYKTTWELPGGAVEADESPRQACVREIAEELGLRLAVGRLLCIEWQGPEPDRTESMMFIYDGGILDARLIQLPAQELSSYAFLNADELDKVTTPRLARRVRAALQAVSEGRVVELEHGVHVEAHPPTPT
jgi:8-oxo-dGTP diphosphatase